MSPSATIHTSGTAVSKSVRLRVDLQNGGELLESSEVWLGDTPTGTDKTITLPAGFHAPLLHAFSLVATVSSANDTDPSNDRRSSLPGGSDRQDEPHRVAETGLVCEFPRSADAERHTRFGRETIGRIAAELGEWWSR